jgi:hypothetical protein
MKRAMLIYAAALALLLSCLAVAINITRTKAEKRIRAELHMIDMIKAGVIDHLDSGGRLPTNWLGVSNVVDWDFVSRMSQDDFIPPATKLYTVLSQSVSGKQHFGVVFLVRSKPYKRPVAGVGRWALTASSNHVKRIWIPKRYLSPEIRSQLTN